MVEHAAQTSAYGKEWKRRYFHWLFKVEGGALMDMKFSTPIEVGTGHARMREEHEPCAGLGCHQCGWWGEIVRLVSDKPGGSQDEQSAHRRNISLGV